ncbi:MAG: hypothetical protein ACI8RZ_000780 [Myxococcota bacterium]|jgi:hypothetical protein
MLDFLDIRESSHSVFLRRRNLSSGSPSGIEREFPGSESEEIPSHQVTFLRLVSLLKPCEHFEPPTRTTVFAAEMWLRELRANIQRDLSGWREPTVSLSSDGEIILEWRCQKRKITLYLAEGGVEYIRSWGPSMVHEMEDGLIQHASEMMPMWQWLKNGDRDEQSEA